MDGPQGRPAPAAANPFSPTAVARLSDLDSGVVTVVTPAIREAVGYLDRYLSAPPAGSGVAGAGDNAVAIVGDYGTGKTHLAVELLHRAKRAEQVAVRTVYLDAPADTFVALHRRFIDHLRRDEIRDEILRYFLETIRPERSQPPPIGSQSPAGSDPRPGSPSTGEDGDRRVAAGLLSEAELRFARRLRGDLAPVTGNPAFATALTLLLRTEYETPVWEWLMGYPPDRSLSDLGVTASADIETTAVEAMGVLALLYCRQGRRFVVVVDELDKILSASNRPGEEAVARFERMLASFAAAGAFLVIAGLPDFLQILGNDVRQRVGPIVKMSAMSGDEVERFISTTQLRAFGEYRLEPFTGETVHYLAHLADGVPRRIIRLCYHLYQRAAQTDSQVSHAMVREVVRVHFDLVSKQDVRAEVRRVLNVEGWNYQRDHLIGSMRSLPVDFWVPVGEQEAGCCLLLTESVLKSEEVDDLNRRALSIRAAIPDSETILVVVGYLPSEFAMELTETFGVEPIVYDPQSFGEDLSAAVKSVMQRLERAIGADALTSVRQRVERIQRQQANTQRFIEQLSAQLDELRAASETGMAAIARQVTAAVSPVPAEPAWSGLPEGLIHLPPQVRQVFSEALDVLDDLTGFQAMLGEAFAAPSEVAAHTAETRTTETRTPETRTPETRSPETRGTESRTPENRGALLSLLRSRDVVRAAGTSEMLRRLIEAFRDGVDEWFRTRAADPAHAGEEDLDRLCDTYRAISEYLPLFQLDVLADVSTSHVGRSDPGVRPISRSSLTDARGVFDGLGARVRRTVLEVAA